MRYFFACILGFALHFHAAMYAAALDFSTEDLEEMVSLSKKELREQWLRRLSFSMLQGRIIDPHSKISLEIKKIKEKGFIEEEFAEAKTACKEHLQTLSSEERDFTHHSLALIDGFALNEVQQELVVSLEDISSSPHILYPKDSVTCTAIARALVHKTSVVDATDSFYQLPLEDWEKREIEKLLITLADSNLIKLALKKRSLEKRGKLINHVHPMRFIGYAFSNSHLRYCMQQIRKSGFKWDGFIDGFSNRMKEEAENNNLVRHSPGLAHYLNINQDQVRSYLEDDDFEGLVRFLLRLG